MALGRQLLTALGIEESKHQAIIDAHMETVEALKAERDSFKADAEKLPKVQEELKKAQAAAKDSGEYDKLKKEFDDYKVGVANKEALAAKKAALEKLCKDKTGAFLSEAGVAKALKYSDYSKIELDEKGEIVGAKDLAKSLREEWKEHAQTVEKRGVDTPTPPAGADGSGGAYSDIRAMTAKWNAAKYGEAPKTGAENGAQK